jgi:hypothetical protein
MKLLTVSAVVLIALVALAWVGYRLLLPRAFVAAGRGALGDARVVQLAGSRSARSAQDFNGAAVEAGPEHKFVLIDVRIDAPADKVDFDDFQLVREKAARLGEERNVGNNDERDHFYWSYLDDAGNQVAEAPGARPFLTRLTFKVPKDARAGYLFYWGLYWGPLDLGTP